MTALPRFRLTLLIPLCCLSASASDELDKEKKEAPETRVQKTSKTVKDGRPPGGDGSMFYKVFVSRSDRNGDGVIEKSEFRGSGDRFDQMDKNKNGKLDRAEIDELHKSRVADPMSMRQRIASGKNRRPPFDLPILPAGGTKNGGSSSSEPGEPTALTPIGTRITAKDAFARLDADENGEVTPEEFRRSPGMNDARKAAEVVKKIDEDNDGVLSFNEFNRVFAKRNSGKPAE